MTRSLRLLAALAALTAMLCAPRAFALTSGNSFITIQNGQISISGALTTPNGGTGIASPTAHDVLIGNGASPMTQVAPGVTGIPFVSQGATSDPAFAAIDLSNSSATTNNLPINRGGTNASSFTSSTCIRYNGTSLVSAAGDCSTPYGNVMAFGSNGNLTAGSTIYTNFSGCTDSVDLNCEEIIEGTHTWKNMQCWNDSIQGSGVGTKDIVIKTAKGSCGTVFGSLTTASMPTVTITGTASANQTSNTDTTNTLNPTAGQCVVAQIVYQASGQNTAHVNCGIEQIS